jgi:hypothetical protein
LIKSAHSNDDAYWNSKANSSREGNTTMESKGRRVKFWYHWPRVQLRSRRGRIICPFWIRTWHQAPFQLYSSTRTFWSNPVDFTILHCSIGDGMTQNNSRDSAADVSINDVALKDKAVFESKNHIMPRGNCCWEPFGSERERYDQPGSRRPTSAQ